MVESNRKFKQNPISAGSPKADSLGTMRDSHEAPLKPAIDDGTSMSPTDTVATGTHSPSSKSRTTIDNAKVILFKYIVPSAIIIALTCWIYQLNSVVKPIERINVNIEYLARENEKIGSKLDSISKPITKMNGDIEHLIKEDEKLNRKTERLEERIDRIVKPIEKIRTDIDGLSAEDEKLNSQIKEVLKQMEKE